MSDAVPARLIVLPVAVKFEPEVGDVMLIVGGVVSEEPAVVEVTVRTAVVTFPAASAAVTVICVEPAGTVTPLIDQLVVPVAVPLAP